VAVIKNGIGPEEQLSNAPANEVDTFANLPISKPTILITSSRESSADVCPLTPKIIIVAYFCP
jgi:hypothetical protein